MQGPQGPQFNRYTLTHTGAFTRDGQVNLWALDPGVRAERIEEFKAIFEPQLAAEAAPAVAEVPVERLSDRLRQPTAAAQQEPPVYTREQLDQIYVTNMTDAQLRQAAAIYTDGPKAQAVRLQIERRQAPEGPAVETSAPRASTVTPQVASPRQLETFIGIAADSVQQLRKVDVERVISEAPAHFRLALVEHIASMRGDLADEAREVATDLARRVTAPPGQVAPSSDSPASAPTTAATNPKRDALQLIDAVNAEWNQLRRDGVAFIQGDPPSTLHPNAPAELKVRWDAFHVNKEASRQVYYAAFGTSPDGKPVNPPVQQPAAQDHVIRTDDNIGEGGLMVKYRDNIRAINIVKALEREQRTATADELPQLARYVGWGGLKGVFDPQNKGWAAQHLELRALLTDAEWAAASRSQLDAFYTSQIVVDAMYGAVRQLGFEGGRVIDPSVGSGNFIGMMPADMREQSEFHGVELDLMTSNIVAALYPSARIAKATGFQSFGGEPGYFDLIIGNPPFGSQQIADTKGSAYSGWSIHNYFFGKSIELARPGALLSMVVSHAFLDKLDPQVREWISRRAELVSAVRLPNTAFRGNANTEVTTDIVILRRLDDRMELGPQTRADWLQTTDIELANPKTGEMVTVPVNNYFLANPDRVLGTHSTAGSLYRANSYTVEPTGDLQQQLRAWVQSLPKGIYSHVERDEPAAAVKTVVGIEIPDNVKEGSFFVSHASGKPVIYQRLTDLNDIARAEAWEPPNERAAERMQGMIEIRDLLRQQMRVERDPKATDAQIEITRKALNSVYDRFRAKNGFLNDAVNRRLFNEDTESPLVQALEFDYEKAITSAYAQEHGVEARAARAVKADIFSQRVLFPPGELEIVENAKDALLHSLNTLGHVDLKYMERAYGKPALDMLNELGDLVFNDPKRGIVMADEYLSGDVKTKLADAREAVKDDPALQRNVAALEKVIPADKLPSEIHAAIGANWIPLAHFRAFGHEITGGKLEFVYVRATGQWLLESSTGVDYAKNQNDYGTSAMSAVKIFNALMNGRAPEVKKTILVDGRETLVTDEEQTEAARQCADKIKSRWESWLWEDDDRAAELATIYNDRFNRTVERQFDGSHLSFPGMNRNIELLSHQKNGVWRGLQDRGMLLDQVVGAGKTFEIVATVMEAKRMGITKKPMLGVPNHLTLQWRSEFYRLYPGANVLAATPADFEAENRERLFSKIATGNWDAVIVGHSSLKKIPLPPGVEADVIGEQLEDISDAIEELKRERGDRHVMRDMEKIKSNLEAKVSKLKEKAGNKSKVVDMMDLGIDSLVIDESHEFKNLWFNTQMQRVSGLGNPAGSGKAFDLFVKTRWLRSVHGQSALMIHATGTPVSNSLAEMFTVQRYLQYDKLRSNGLHVFDAWAKMYGDVQNVYEVSPSGTGYRLSQRFAKFKNLGSLMGEYRSFADVVTLQDLKAQEIARGKVFPVPQLAGGRPNNVVVRRSALQEAFFGVPEIARDEHGKIKFEVTLSPDAPMSVQKAADGKFEVHQTRGGKYLGRGPGRYETPEEAAYATALAAITPVMSIDPKSIIGQFENLRELTRSTKGKINALSLTSLANKAGLDYRLINPAARDDPNSKVNEAIKRMMTHWEGSQADRGVQLVFCDLSVPLSAKAKMASKEKRIYVRDADGAIQHAKGTLHAVPDNDETAYFVVATGRASARTFSIYDPTTGQVMKEGLDSKKDAHTFVLNFFKTAGGAERWLDQRAQSPVIDDAEIDEYKAGKGLDAEGDAADVEFSRSDIEGATGVANFSVYDDMKAKLIERGVPAAEIEFIHDHDTPQAKATLFKRVNSGEVRFLFGSTPKMGAGTNVQSLIVALHNIDAPYRPSDLEQREGRAIRRGNKLYERDPEGFRMHIYRYATEQTYDTRRWQLLEHKASGIEQLRNYTVGVNEIEDVTTEAANSADMKAAASGNPLILKETQLSNDVKRLRSLERAHRDGQYAISSRARSYDHFAKQQGPREAADLQALIDERNASKGVSKYGARTLHTREAMIGALDDIKAHLGALGTPKSLTFQGLEFIFSLDKITNDFVLKLPDGDLRQMEKLSPAGCVTRMENFIAGLDERLVAMNNQIQHAANEAVSMRALTGKPFEQAAELETAIHEHGKCQRALRKSNYLAAVKPAEAKAFEAAVARQKDLLRSMGFGEALDELEREDREDVALKPGAIAQGAVQAPTGAYIGQILSIDAGIVVQKVGREGQSMSHQLADISDRGSDLKVGQVVTITYSQGLAKVSPESSSHALGR